MDGWMGWDGWMDRMGWMDGWMDGWGFFLRFLHVRKVANKIKDKIK